MKKIIFLVSLFPILYSLFFLSGDALAQKGLGNAMKTLDNAVGDVGLEKELSTTVGTVVKTALSLVGTLFLILMVYAGILWMTAQGEQEKVEKAHKIIKACIIGLFITLSAYAITYFVTTKMGGSNSSGGAASQQQNQQTSGSQNDAGCCVVKINGGVFESRTCYVGQSPSTCQGQPVSSCAQDCSPL
ncbi:hypothetical protein EPN28_00635 [Patescibacteria group bacterium]|nr:MAG: hypothetical protein EPN28_00635 [Patescibacteria group bacterium]